MKVRLLLPALLALFCCACVTNIHPDVTGNPPPAEPLSDFQHYQLMPATISPEAAHENEAFAAISTYLDQRVGPTVAGWQNRNQSGRTLRIEPRIEQLKMVGVGARFWAGNFAGSSAVVMKLKLTDVDTGRVIAEPEFYQRANAWAGGFSVGGTDRGMLARIITVTQEYLQRNYASAVGGPTGLEESAN